MSMDMPFNMSQIINDELPVRVVGYAKEPFSGEKSMTKTFNEPMDMFVIANEGPNELTFIINKMLFKVKPKTSFSETFVPFKKVIIYATSPFQAYGVNSIASKGGDDLTLAKDSFNRTTSATVLGKTDTGQTWEHYRSAGPTTTDWIISNNKAMVKQTSFNAAVVDTGIPDFYSVEADIVMASASVSDYGGLMISFADVANNVFFRGDSTTGELRLYIASGISAYAMAKAVPYTFTNGQTVKFKAIKKGTSIEIFADGTSVLTYTLSDADNVRVSGPKQGLFLKSPLASADNFEVKIIEV